MVEPYGPCLAERGCSVNTCHHMAACVGGNDGKLVSSTTARTGDAATFDRYYRAGMLPLSLHSSEALGGRRLVACWASGPPFAACTCYLPSRDVVTAAASLESRGERLAWFAAKDQMRATIHMRQFDCGAATAEVELGQIEVRGLPWSILKHIRQAVLPLWNEGGCLQPGPAAVVVRESSFAWSRADKTLTCGSWYGCYWLSVLRNASCSPENDRRPRGFAYSNSSRFERRWGPLFYAAATIDAWWRPADVLQQRINDRVDDAWRLASLNPDRGDRRCIAIHIRRGDACATPWRRCPSVEDYLQVARTMARRYGIRTLALATDDAEVAAMLTTTRDEKARPWDRVVAQPIDRTQYQTNASHCGGSGKHCWVETKLKRGQLSSTPVLDVLADVELLSGCSAFVGSFDSRTSELIFMRMVARRGVVPPFYSVQGPLCPLSVIGRPGSLLGDDWCRVLPTLWRTHFDNKPPAALNLSSCGGVMDG
jgi:hypothetical protein